MRREFGDRVAACVALVTDELGAIRLGLRLGQRCVLPSRYGWT
jgi:hypothetical protein